MSNTSLTIVLQCLLGAVALICLLGSITILRQGARVFVPAGSIDTRMDNVLRYLGGMYLGLGVLIAYTAATAAQQGTLVWVVVAIVLLAAGGRAFSRTVVGAPPRQYDRFMWVEFAFAIAIALAQILRAAA